MTNGASDKKCASWSVTEHNNSVGCLRGLLVDAAVLLRNDIQYRPPPPPFIMSAGSKITGAQVHYRPKVRQKKEC